MLKPLCAVLSITPDSWVCQWISLTSVCPWWINNNCGGTCGSSVLWPAASASRSTAKSQNVIWSSEPDAANTDPSVGCHCTDVMGAVWCLNTATAFPCCNNTTMTELLWGYLGHNLKNVAISLHIFIIYIYIHTYTHNPFHTNFFCQLNPFYTYHAYPVFSHENIKVICSAPSNVDPNDHKSYWIFNYFFKNI